jgi:hypothetical protein
MLAGHGEVAKDEAQRQVAKLRPGGSAVRAGEVEIGDDLPAVAADVVLGVHGRDPDARQLG